MHYFIPAFIEGSKNLKDHAASSIMSDVNIEKVARQRCCCIRSNRYGSPHYDSDGT